MPCGVRSVPSLAAVSTHFFVTSNPVARTGRFIGHISIGRDRAYVNGHSGRTCRSGENARQVIRPEREIRGTKNQARKDDGHTPVWEFWPALESACRSTDHRVISYEAYAPYGSHNIPAGAWRASTPHRDARDKVRVRARSLSPQVAVHRLPCMLSPGPHEP